MRKPGVRLAVCAGALLVSACFASSGCRSSGTPAASTPATPAAAAASDSLSDISGTYECVSINGSALPYTMTHEPPGVRVTSGSLRIDADGTCVGRTEFVMPSGEARNREVRARWTRDGATLHLSWEGAGTTTGTIAGDTFTMENEGQILAYRRAK